MRISSHERLFNTSGGLSRTAIFACRSTDKTKTIRKPLHHLKYVIVLFLWALHTLSADGAKGVFKCYSCMSRYYGHMWQFAGYSRIYVKPHAFTDDCKNPGATNAEVPYVYCEDYSNCIAMAEDLQIGMGPRGYIRGCWSSLFLWGFNRSGNVGALRHHDFCSKFNFTQLPSTSTDIGRTFESQMTVCSCIGNLCNKKPFTSTAARPQLLTQNSLWPFVLITASLFLFVH